MTFNRLFLLVMSLLFPTALRAIDTPDMPYAPQVVVLSDEMRAVIERFREDAQNNPMNALNAPDSVILAEITHALEFNTLTALHHAAYKGNWHLVKKIMGVFKQAGAQTSLNYLNRTTNDERSLTAHQMAHGQINYASPEMKNSFGRIASALRMRACEIEGSIHTQRGEKSAAASEWNRTKKAF